MFKLPRSSAVFLFLLVLLTSTAYTARTAPAAQAKWTVMVYMSGDNNLDEYIVKDIEQELALTGSSDEVQVVALADRGPVGDWTKTLLFNVTQGMTAAPENAVQDWGEANMGDPQTLIDFVRWTKSNYPAEHYALYFWGHGWNWRPEYFMRDDTDWDTLDMHELEYVFAQTGPIDVIGFDACNMASIEVQAQLRPYSSALVHSQEFITEDGIEYDVLLAQLTANPDMTPDQVAIATSQSVTSDKTMSAVALNSDFDALIAAVDAWSHALSEGLDEYRKSYDRAFRVSKDFWQAPMDKDLYDLAFQISSRVDDPAINALSQAVMEAVDMVVLDEHHVVSHKDVHGITINFMDWDDVVWSGSGVWDPKEYYDNYLVFSRLTRWDEFLGDYSSGE